MVRWSAPKATAKITKDVMNKLVMNSLVCSLLLLGAGCSPRSSAAPEGALSAERSFKPPVPERWTLPNGLTVMYLKDTELPLVTGTIYVRAGGLWEPEGRIGIAGAMGELMRQGGAGNLSADALDERLEKLSASVSSSVGGEFGSVAFGSLSGDFETVFGLATDVLLRPRFEQSRIELWKGQSLEGIRRRTDDPWTVAGIAFGQLVYGNTPYGRVGTEKFGPVDTVVPAHNSAVADLTTLATMLAEFVGSTTTVESSAPPKPVRV